MNGTTHRDDDPFADPPIASLASKGDAGEYDDEEDDEAYAEHVSYRRCPLR